MIRINLPDGMNLVAEQSTDSDFPYEIYIGIEDSRGMWVQDLAVVRNSYHFDNNGEVSFERESYDVFVYGDSDCEDYTEWFRIGLRHDEL